LYKREEVGEDLTEKRSLKDADFEVWSDVAIRQGMPAVINN
jgi:hypothetical protein